MGNPGEYVQQHTAPWEWEATLVASENPIKVGVVGLGRSGYNIHIARMRNDERYQVTAVTDWLEDRRGETGKELGCAVYEDHRALLKGADADVVVVASYSDTHAGHLLYHEELPSQLLPSLVSHTIPVQRSLPRSVLNRKYPGDPKSLADRLRTTRIDLHLTVEQVAMLTGFSQSAVMAWEAGRRKPTAESLRRISEFYRSRS